jgi:hypothetical protein
MGIELGRVGSADLAKSTVMMQLLAAHHEALGQKNALNAQHEELEKRHYELLKAQARMEVEREADGGGSPRRNGGGSHAKEGSKVETYEEATESGKISTLVKIEAMVEGLHKQMEEHGKLLNRTERGAEKEKDERGVEEVTKHESR